MENSNEKKLNLWQRSRKGMKIAICSLGIAGVLTGIIVPTAIVLNKNKTFTVTFDSDGGTKVESQIVKNGEKATRPNDPKKGDIEYNIPFNEWQLNGSKFDFSNPITRNINLKANYNITLKTPWYLDTNYINSLTIDDVGVQRGVIVNTKLHKVRLIGIDHDTISNSTEKAHTTWEFSNIISDSNGDSLAYQWNDTNNESTANDDYINSTIRYALTGEGWDGGTSEQTKRTLIFVAQKNTTSWSTDPSYKDKTILSMLPTDLTNKLKVVEKTVGIYDSSITEGEKYKETTYNDKLFLPSTIELGFTYKDDKGYGSTYHYYKEAKKLCEVIRVKKPVNNVEFIVKDKDDPECIKIPSTSAHLFNGDVVNYAGYNRSTDDTLGGSYWVCSPYFKSDEPNEHKLARRCRYDGSFEQPSSVYVFARGVAPAFCL